MFPALAFGATAYGPGLQGFDYPYDACTHRRGPDSRNLLIHRVELGPHVRLKWRGKKIAKPVDRGSKHDCGLFRHHESANCAYQLAPDVTSAGVKIKMPALVRGNPSAVWRVPS
jgi:hypothetical protein